MVLLNCNFVFTCMIMCGITTILQCIPVIYLHLPCLLVSCNVHISWKHTHDSTCLVEAHTFITRCYVYAIVVNLFVLSHIPSMDRSPATCYISWHFTFCGTSCLVALHISWYSMSCATSRLIKIKISTGNFQILHANICV